MNLRLVGVTAVAAGGIMSAKATSICKPVMDRSEHTTYDIRGPLGERIRAVVNNWLIPAPDSNPAMTAMFRDRERIPARALMPWSGEFAGKHLISGVQTLRLTGDRRLKKALKTLVDEITAAQDASGYLGPFDKSARMTGGDNWDLWGQYHVMLGLLMWHQETGDKSALAACLKCADFFCRYFMDEGHRVYDARNHEMNESCIHVFALLYRETGNERYLQLCREIEQDWEKAPSGDYVRQGLAGVPFWQTPKPRWESLPSLQALAELVYITGDNRYKAALEQLWWSIVQGDRHNTGGFSSGEQATGNPYHQGAIETCCTVAWMALTADYVKLSGDSRAADELELSTWNATLGSIHPSGRWATYNTPMDGVRKASAHDIVFQAAPGSPELNCCSVNAPRGLGVLNEWALLLTPDGPALNYYGPGTMTTELEMGVSVRLEQQTDYPASSVIRLKVTPERNVRFTLKLRVPSWSSKTEIRVNGEVYPAQSGTYCAIDREWKPGDIVEITLDFGLWCWQGEKECQGRTSVYRGPVLLAYDPRFDACEPGKVPAVDISAVPNEVKPPKHSGPAPLVLLRLPTRDGGTLTLCDFASAGAAGNAYISWLPGDKTPPAAWSKGNPLRLTR